MQLVTEIIDLLSSDNPSLTNALFKAQVLAHRLGENELKQWVSNELKGYPIDCDVPSYRIAHVTIQGTITDGHTYRHDFVIPMMKVNSEIREKLEVCKFVESIAALERWASVGKEYGKVVAPEFFPHLRSGLSKAYSIERAVGIFNVGAVSQVLAEVRSRLLEMALQISDRIPKEPETESLKKISKEANVSEIFKGAVFGNNTTIVVGNGSISGVSNVVTKNDAASLIAALQSHLVSPNDIEALKSAMKEDLQHRPEISGSIGSAVSDWMVRMTKKAAEGTWDVGVQAAGSILGTAIAAYYGIGKA